MKISILIPDFRGGGAERVNLDLAYQFSRLGHDVEFVVMNARGEFLEEAMDFFSVTDLATNRVRKLPCALIGYLKRRRPDAFLCSMWPLTLVGPLAASFSGHRCKVLVAEHNTLSIQYGDWGWLHKIMLQTSMRIGYQLAHLRVAVSAGVAEDIARLSGLCSDRFEVIQNPVPPRPEPSESAIISADTLWGVPPGGRVVVVGSMKAQKNLPLLLRAFARLNRTDVRLMFVGDGNGRDALISLAEELGVANRVIFTGFQSDPTPFYQTADVFALSSNHEGFGNVIVEAMACGTPVVSTNCPSGPSEILDGGKYGRLVPVGDVDALSSAIASTLDELPPKEELKARASEFHPAKAAEAYLKLLGTP